MHAAGIIVFVGFLVFVAHMFNALFAKTRVPDVLMLILIGIIVGPVLGQVTPDHFGGVGPMFVTVALVVILFEGGLGLRLRDLHKTFGGTMTLTMSTFLGTVTIATVVGYYLTDLDLIGSLLLGTVLGATSPAIVIPIVKQLNMRNNSRTVLTVESAISEVLCIVLTIAILDAYKPGAMDIGIMLGKFISSFVIAVIIGVVSAVGWSTLLHKVRSLENSIFLTPAFVFIVYGIVELIGFNGAISALAFGVTLGNIWVFNVPMLKQFISVEPIALNRTEKIFFSEFVFLLKTFFFFYVGISIELSGMEILLVGGLITLLIYLVRIPAVGASMDKTNTYGEAAVTAVMVPKGLASAVVASIPLQEGFPGGEIIQSVTYSVVLFSIVLTSALIFLLDKTVLIRAYAAVYSKFKKEAAPLTER
jgi:NhaP-type Na+/H+ or K+/H+ antiporter